LPHDTSAPPAIKSSWPGVVRHAPEVVESYDGMVATLRGFLDKLAGARPDADTLTALTRDLAAWSGRLDACAVDERDQLFGRLVRQPGRGQTASPQLFIDRQVEGELVGRVTFGRYFLGVNGAVHGGIIPLLFDEVLGRAAADPKQPRIRTAYLNTAFKALTPIDVELEVRGWLDRVEGRKRFVRGELRHGDIVCAEAEGLFVELRPEQA
jgi:acyl-coenzyme A thioesterase PaaI-like protein